MLQHSVSNGLITLQHTENCISCNIQEQPSHYGNGAPASTQSEIGPKPSFRTTTLSLAMGNICSYVARRTTRTCGVPTINSCHTLVPTPHRLRPVMVSSKRPIFAKCAWPRVGSQSREIPMAANENPLAEACCYRASLARSMTSGSAGSLANPQVDDPIYANRMSCS